jgi:hypothetical protein
MYFSGPVGCGIWVEIGGAGPEDAEEVGALRIRGMLLRRTRTEVRRTIFAVIGSCSSRGQGRSYMFFKRLTESGKITPVAPVKEVIMGHGPWPAGELWPLGD